jgi:hypothetical protein
VNALGANGLDTNLSISNSLPLAALIPHSAILWLKHGIRSSYLLLQDGTIKTEQ